MAISPIDWTTTGKTKVQQIMARQVQAHDGQHTARQQLQALRDGVEFSYQQGKIMDMVSVTFEMSEEQRCPLPVLLVPLPLGSAWGTWYFCSDHVMLLVQAVHP